MRIYIGKCHSHMPCVLPTAVSGGSGVPNPSLSSSGLSEVLLWRCVSLTPRGNKWMLEEDTGSGVKSWAEGLRCEQEVLRTDTGSGDRGAVCVARTSLVVQEGGVGEKPGPGGDCWAGQHSMCPSCCPGIELHSGPGWRHLGSSPYQIQS